MIDTRITRLICLGSARTLTLGGDGGLTPEEFGQPYP